MSDTQDNGTSRMTVNRTAPVVAALDRLRARSGSSKSAVCNRAVLALDFIEEERAKGKELCLRDADGRLERVHII